MYNMTGRVVLIAVLYVFLVGSVQSIDLGKEVFQLTTDYYWIGDSHQGYYPQINGQPLDIVVERRLDLKKDSTPFNIYENGEYKERSAEKPAPAKLDSKLFFLVSEDDWLETTSCSLRTVKTQSPSAPSYKAEVYPQTYNGDRLHHGFVCRFSEETPVGIYVLTIESNGQLISTIIYYGVKEPFAKGAITALRHAQGEEGQSLTNIDDSKFWPRMDFKHLQCLTVLEDFWTLVDFVQDSKLSLIYFIPPSEQVLSIMDDQISLICSLIYPAVKMGVVLDEKVKMPQAYFLPYRTVLPLHVPRSIYPERRLAYSNYVQELTRNATELTNANFPIITTPPSYYRKGSVVVDLNSFLSKDDMFSSFKFHLPIGYKKDISNPVVYEAPLYGSASLLLPDDNSEDSLVVLEYILPYDQIQKNLLKKPNGQYQFLDLLTMFGSHYAQNIFNQVLFVLEETSSLSLHHSSDEIQSNIQEKVIQSHVLMHELSRPAKQLSFGDIVNILNPAPFVQPEQSSFKQHICSLSYPEKGRCVPETESSDMELGGFFRNVPSIESGLEKKNCEKVPREPNCPDMLISKHRGTVVDEAKGVACIALLNSVDATVLDYNNDGLPDVVFSRREDPPALYKNMGDGRFTDVTEITGLNTLLKGVIGMTAARVADIDQDGDQDIYILTTATNTRHYLLINHNYGEYFTEEAMERGLAVHGNYLKGGTGIDFGDFDGDGWVDIYITEWIPASLRSYDRDFPSDLILFKNKGKNNPGHFVDVTDAMKVGLQYYTDPFFSIPQDSYGFQPIFVDFDNDGRLDIYVSSDFGTATMFWNEGDHFVESTLDAFLSTEENGMGAVVADFNNDGLLDLISTSMEQISRSTEKLMQCQGNPICSFGWTGNRLYINKGNRKFEDQTDQWGSIRATYWGWGVDTVDWDNDADLDLAIENGYQLAGTTIEDQFNDTPRMFFLNSGNFFTSIGERIGFDKRASYTRGVAHLDYDGDGDLDIIISEIGAKLELLENVDFCGSEKSENRFIRISPLNEDGQHALHTWVELYPWSMEELATEEMQGRLAQCETDLGADNIHCTYLRGQPMRAVVGLTGGKVYAQSEPVVHFGLGQDMPSVLHKLILRFPRYKDQKASVLEVLNLESNRLYEFGQPISDSMIRLGDSVDACEHYVPVPEDRVLVLEENVTDDISKKLPDSYSLAMREPDGLFFPRLSFGKEFYSYDGMNNNMKNPSQGAHKATLKRVLPHAYEDGKQSPSGKDRKGVREISNTLFHQPISIPSSRNLTSMHVIWGQFLAHDLTLVNPLSNIKSEINFPIEVPKHDLWFDPNGTGEQVIRFARSVYDAESGNSVTRPREQINLMSSYIDSSQVYGIHGSRAEYLREEGDGTLQLNEKGLLPTSHGEAAVDNPLDRKISNMYIAGDPRVNENPILTAVHTIFTREHNRLATKLRREDPSLSAEEVYQRARQIVIAEAQVITYEEYLRSLLGENLYSRIDCTKYDPNVDATIANSFAAASFRFGHSQVNDDMLLLESDGSPFSFSPRIPLRETYFHPDLVRTHGIEPFLLGAVHQISEEIDALTVSAIRNFLFGDYFSGGLDLASANMQRGRDHGLPDYNSARKALKLAPKQSFAEITSDEATQKKLMEAYSSVDDIDLFAGFLSEDHAEGSSVGELLGELLIEQFQRSCKGDRFFYKHRYSPEEVERLEEITFGELIRINTNLQKEVIPPNVFQLN